MAQINIKYFQFHVNRGVSGLDKTDETKNLNQTKPKKYPILSGSVQNRTEPI